jgi:hypothetical protein
MEKGRQHEIKSVKLQLAEFADACWKMKKQDRETLSHVNMGFKSQ